MKKNTLKIMKRSEQVQTVDSHTGEVTQETHSTLKMGDFGFCKIWLPNFEDHILKIGNKQTQVLFYLLNNMNRENVITKTQEEIAKEVCATTKTVRECMKTLQTFHNDEAPFLVRIGQSRYRINPDVIYNGASNKRVEIMKQFVRETTKAKRYFSEE